MDAKHPHSSSKPSIALALVVGLVLGLVIGRAFTGGGSTDANGQRAGGARAPHNIAATVFRVPVEGSPTAGRADALVTLVEFTDYECPFCSRAHATVQALQKEYGNKLRVVMKQNPLSFHANARPAALAALAAGQQGKYWEMHDTLFANNKALTGPDLEKYAQEIGLDVARWKADMQRQDLAEVIQRDQALAAQVGANGTPAFFVNGRFLSGALPTETFRSLIDEELEKAEKLVKAGTPASGVYAAVMAQGVEKAPQAAPPPAAAPAVRKVDVPADSPSFGPKNAKVTIVEWSDFQCPFCARAAPTVAEIKKAYPNDVRFVFRHQPLAMHPDAPLAAEASMAAHEQGKFWEMHDKLFSNVRQMKREDIERYATELKLDLGKFKAALDSGKYRGKVQADMAAGSAVGADGTPTFFINGREFVGAQPFAAFKAVIDQEIAKADKLLAAGVKPDQLYTKLVEQGMAEAPAAAKPAAPQPAQVVDVPVGNAPAVGPKNAPVKVVLFSDFECPFCSRAAPVFRQLEEKYRGKVQLAFKHQPLDMHRNARIAAAASMAAHEQGKFWEMHDKMFANARALDRASLERYASELKLDMGKFKAALDSNKFDAHISADQELANRVGANGTPTFFVNGRQMVGFMPLEQIAAVVDEELRKAGGNARAAP